VPSPSAVMGLWSRQRGYMTFSCLYQEIFHFTCELCKIGFEDTSPDLGFFLVVMYGAFSFYRRIEEF